MMGVEIKLENLLNQRQITLYRLCKDTNLSYQQGIEIMKGRTRRIDFQTIEILCRYLNCDASELIFYKKDYEKLESIIEKFPLTENSKRTGSLNQNRKAKPFLQWVGGKREMVLQYKKFFPKKFKTYFEPFLGGGAMFFKLNPHKSIISDNNLELIKTYEGVRDQPNKVIELLNLFKRRHSKELYIKTRELDREMDIFQEFQNYEIAARMIYLNQTCFNGVYRVNQKGQFNVPIGSSLDRLICDESTIKKASTVLKEAQLHCVDFSKSIQSAGKNDFVYLDPPYFPVSAYSDFTRYTKEKFYKEDQIRLKEKFDELNKKGAFVMLSNSSVDFIKDLYHGYNIQSVYSSRSLNCKSEKRGKVNELLIMNY